MNRKQFLVLLAVLVVLVAAGAGLIYSKRSAWKSADERIGQRLAAGLTIGNVAEILIQEPGAALTLKKVGDGWRLQQPEDAPADLERIGNLLQKLLEIKIVQTEAIPESVRTALMLRPPKDAQKAGAGTVLELKDAAGKVLSRFLLGKTIVKPREGAPAGAGVPAGRYVLVGAEQGTAMLVSDPLEQVEAKPEVWRAREPPPAPPESAKAPSAGSEPKKN
jgi:hypothetical protein